MEGKQALLTRPMDSPFRYSTFSSLGGLGALHGRSTHGMHLIMMHSHASSADQRFTAQHCCSVRNNVFC